MSKIGIVTVKLSKCFQTTWFLCNEKIETRKLYKIKHFGQVPSNCRRKFEYFRERLTDTCEIIKNSTRDTLQTNSNNLF